MKSQEKILNLLLMICAVTVPSTLILTWYLVDQHSDIQNLKATLLSKNELQTEMLQEQPLDRALFPHWVDEIGYVLNPFMSRSSYKAFGGDSYEINNLGLRGKDVEAKKPGVTRVLLVGDSVTFGWKLKDQDRLSSQLSSLVEKTPGAENKYEFITIALPGWNVVTQRAFLDNHMLLLDPDVVVWWSIRNDIEDVYGTIVPGKLAMWASPQKQNYTPFSGLQLFHRQLRDALPIFAERFARNLNLIASFEKKHDIPVFLINLPELNVQDKASALFKHQIYIPREYVQDKQWQLSKADSHPTPWAIERVALGILSKLKRSGFIKEMKFSDDQRKITKAFEDKEKQTLTSKPHLKNYSDLLAKIPSSFTRKDPDTSNSIVYGINERGLMNKAGTLLLRDVDNSSHLILRVNSLENVEKYPGTVVFSVRNRDAQENHKTVQINAKSIDVRIKIPEHGSSSAVYELSWVYDYMRCKAPTNCSSGHLMYAGFGN